jgi:hypothetical protein
MSYKHPIADAPAGVSLTTRKASPCTRRVGEADRHDELIERWREASRDAELAARLAELAIEAAKQADRDTLAAKEIAEIAQRVATHAERAARVARQAVDWGGAFGRRTALGARPRRATQERLRSELVRTRHPSGRSEPSLPFATPPTGHGSPSHRAANRSQADPKVGFCPWPQ